MDIYNLVLHIIYLFYCNKENVRTRIHKLYVVSNNFCFHDAVLKPRCVIIFGGLIFDNLCHRNGHDDNLFWILSSENFDVFIDLYVPAKSWSHYHVTY